MSSDRENRNVLKSIACEKKFSNLVIVGLGVFDEKFDSKFPATLEVSLVKFCHKKRKDQITPVSSVPIGSCELSVNSNDQPHLPAVLAVPKQYFNLMNGHLVKHYSLQFKVTASHSQTCNSEIKSDLINGDDRELPSSKKRKLTNQVEYQRELTVIDQNYQCVLIDGKYQLVLEEITKDSTNCSLPAQQSSWEPLQRDKSNGSLIFGKGPLLVFHLFWTDSGLESFTCPGRLNPRNFIVTIDCNNENNRLIHVGGISTSSSNLLLPSNGFISTKAASPCECSSHISSSKLKNRPTKPSLSSHTFYRSTDCVPIKPQTMDEDSEAEIDPEWSKVKTQIMIDEFADVNEGEKEVMKLWNLYGMKHRFVADCQIPLACDKFVEQYWQELFKRNLYKNFILHLNNLFDFGILPAASMRSIIQRLNQYRNQSIKKQESR